jgi:hypothetical protein
MVRRVSALVVAAVAAVAVLAGCGSSDSGPSAGASDRARTAVEQGLLSTLRTAPGNGAVSSVRCAGRGTDGRHWTCHLAGARPQDVAVTVNADGWWSASGVRAAPAPPMSSGDAYTGDFTDGVALMGCCVPRS